MKAKTKKISVLFFIAVVLAAVRLFDAFVLAPDRAASFTISPVSFFCSFVGNPVFWTVIGSLIITVLSETFSLDRCSRKTAVLLLTCGVLMLAVYAVLLICYLNVASAVVSRMIAWVMKYSVLFLIPGVLIGMYQSSAE